MCFSATASFTASAVLGGIGIATVKNTKDRSDLPVASIPLFFAIQQAGEGFLWLALKGNSPISQFISDNQLVMFLTYFFLFYAFLWWPIYTPCAYYLAEKVRGRKIVMGALIVGGLISGVTLYSSFMLQPVTPRIIGSCINYDAHLFVPAPILALYVIATIGAGLISSNKTIRMFSMLLGISAAVTSYQYYINFTSVWCFFAAVLSVILYRNSVQHQRQEGSSPMFAFSNIFKKY